MNFLLSLWTWLEIGLMSLLGFIVQLALAIVTWPFDRRRYVTGRCLRRTAWMSAKLTPFWRFGVHGPVPKQLASRTVVVSNHESNADPFLIFPPALGDEVAGQGEPLQDPRGGLEHVAGGRHSRDTRRPELRQGRHGAVCPVARQGRAGDDLPRGHALENG
ncbi:hypothetical protein STIAU_6666 [Stigmatella aurantiaca DW4/3-1]|uniref:1-acyl-sn-glycerol-3-phosphate acyltransferase n=1 Tax=Stigmatella aurantiaca (strain DW4/3-1) TaxID=378806 RepID=Q08NK9_STIAD|nr:hypothetical protein STIAU_6666 [Stigmatella aurantiaca DW4/3-1]